MNRLKKAVTAVCMALIMAVQTAFPAFAQGGEIDGIYGYFTRGDGFYDELEFGENDWAAYCRIRLYGTEGAQDYLARVEDAAERLLQSEGFVKPTELQRAAIVLSAAGMCSERLICAAVYNNETLNRQGFNAYIWALIAANCCDIPQSDGAVNTKASLAGEIISRQLDDGGFALMGNAADADITAEAIYALAPLGEDEIIAEALNRAERRLLEMQLESGGFASMGMENCESTAQAIIALCTLGHDENSDSISRALEALIGYRTEDGGFSHTVGGASDGLATAQALMALTALRLAESGERLFEAADNSVDIAANDGQMVENPSGTAKAEPQSTTESTTSGSELRIILTVCAAVLGAALIIVWLVRGRRRFFLLAAGIAAVALATVLAFSDVRTPSEYYSDSGGTGEITVMISADCREAAENPQKAQRELTLPADGYIISPMEITLADGSTAFDALIAAARKGGVTVEHTSSPMGVYVAGIGALYEFDYGSESGWLYSVNGERPSCALSAYTVSQGDVIALTYTTHLSY